MVGIALKYDITVEDIRRCNNLWTNDALWPGQVIFFVPCLMLYRSYDQIFDAMQFYFIININSLVGTKDSCKISH